MAKAMQMQSNSKPGAWIVSTKDRGRKSIKKGKVYLEDNSEFEIELFNPLKDCVLADIKLNGNSISKNGLVIKPGQRVYLDCFIDYKKKFVFKTYEVESNLESLEAIEKNGLLEVFFYKEDVVSLNNWKNRFDKIIIEKWYPYQPYNPYDRKLQPYPYYPNIWYGTNDVIRTTTNLNSLTTTGTCYSSNIDLSNISNRSCNMTLINSPIETGRIERGEVSKQKFTEVDMDFENHYIASTIIQILPESVKPTEVKDLKKEVKNTLKDYIKRESDEVIDLIKKLAELHSAGILTDDEFSEKKSELLSKI
jgi:hypothetical protein